MSTHEYKFVAHTRQGSIQCRLHSPSLKTYERLRGAENVISSQATDEQKLSALFELFSPGCYQFEFGKIKTIIEPAV